MLDPCNQKEPCNIVIIGASGDLSRRKLLPALFSLYCNDLLPVTFQVFGFARSEMTDDEFRQLAMENLTCRYDPDGDGSHCCAQKMEEFLQRLHYFRGQYDSAESFSAFAASVQSISGACGNRLFYMSIPPSVFLDTAHSLHDAGLLACDHDHWTRVVVEKPFGRDAESSAQLGHELSRLFSEEQTYRIDHYLGKEVIQNLLVLRFANLVFEPLWNHKYIEYVSISFAEDIGTGGRAGYFDHYGIIRDVLQNHLIQIMALVAMEQPVSFGARDIADEKVKLLRCVPAIELDDLIVGQYVAAEHQGKQQPGYLDDPDVPDDSITPTYAHATMWINNPRWYGVPFYLSAGKALDTRKTEIHVKFRGVPYSIFQGSQPKCSNDLHIRVQPNEAIELHLANKVPGLTMEMETVKLDMLYQSAFNAVLAEAYERLLLEVMRGDRSLFIQERELAVSWDIVTPVLHELEEKRIKPEPYPFGSAGPEHGLPI